MKKSLILAVAIVLSGLGVANAGHFTDLLPPAATSGCVPVSNGYDWQCSSDAGSAVIISSNTGPGLWMRTIAQLNALTPLQKGQLVYCGDCTGSPVCVSSGTGTGAWTVIGSTGGIVPGISHCQ